MVCLRHCGRHRRNREDDHRVAARRDERTVLARGDRRPPNEGPFPRIPEKEVALTLFKVDLKNGVRDSHLHTSESRFHSIFTGGRSLSITPYWATKDGERSHPHPDASPAIRGQSERGASRGGERSCGPRRPRRAARSAPTPSVCRGRPPPEFRECLRERGGHPLLGGGWHVAEGRRHDLDRAEHRGGFLLAHGSPRRETEGRPLPRRDQAVPPPP